MNIKKTALAIAMCGGAALTSVNANAFMVDGVTMDAGAQLITTTLWEKTLSSVHDTLEGVGIVRNITGPSGTTWIENQNDTQLSYYFSGYSVGAWYNGAGTKYVSGDVGFDTLFLTDAIAIDFASGSLKVYSDRVSTGTFVNPSASLSPATDIANATDGNLWADYMADVIDTFTLGLGTRTGTLFATNTGGTSIHASGTGFGYLDIIGGLAYSHLDTNAFVPNPGGDDADALFDASYSTTNPAGWDLSGSGTFKTTAIPEPGTLALAGLALVGMTAFGRKRKA